MKRKLVVQPSSTLLPSILPLVNLPSIQSNTATVVPPTARLAALDLDSTASNSRKRKLEDSAHDTQRCPSPSPASLVPPTERTSRASATHPASTAPPPVIHKDHVIPRIAILKASTTQTSRPPPNSTPLTSLPILSTSTTPSMTQQSSEWDLVSVRFSLSLVSLLACTDRPPKTQSTGQLYTSLKCVKDKRATGSKQFCLVVVKTGKLSPPRTGRKDDRKSKASHEAGDESHTDPLLPTLIKCSLLCTFLRHRPFARSQLTRSLFIHRRTSMVRTRPFETSKFQPWRCTLRPKFEREQVPSTPFTLRKTQDFTCFSQITLYSKLRRYHQAPHPPYLSLPISSLSSSSTLPSLESLVFKDSSQLKLSQPEFDRAMRLAKFYRGRMLDSDKEGEGIEYQLKRLDGQTKPRELGEFSKSI